MKISQLSRASGVALPTVKFYLREGILPLGERSAPNQATYGEQHLERLRLVRVLRDVGNLSIAAIREVVRALEAPPPRGDSPHRESLIIQVADAIGREAGPPLAPALTSGEGRPEAETDVARFIKSLGWQVRPNAASSQRLADVLLALRRVSFPELPVEAFHQHAAEALRVASYENNAGMPGRHEGMTGKIEEVVAGTILWEIVLTTLRRMAHEHLERLSIRESASAPQSQTISQPSAV